MGSVVVEHDLEAGQPSVLTRLPPTLIDEPGSCPADDTSTAAVTADLLGCSRELATAPHTDGSSAVDDIHINRVTMYDRRRRGRNAARPWRFGTRSDSGSVRLAEIDEWQRHTRHLLEWATSTTPFRNGDRCGPQESLHPGECPLSALSGLGLAAPEPQLTSGIGDDFLWDQP